MSQQSLHQKTAGKILLDVEFHTGPGVMGLLGRRAAAKRDADVHRRDIEAG